MQIKHLDARIVRGTDGVGRPGEGHPAYKVKGNLKEEMSEYDQLVSCQNGFLAEKLNFTLKSALRGKFKAIQCGARSQVRAVFISDYGGLALRNEAGFAGPEAGIPVQKKGALGSLQKKNFLALEKARFFGTL